MRSASHTERSSPWPWLVWLTAALAFLLAFTVTVLRSERSAHPSAAAERAPSTGSPPSLIFPSPLAVVIVETPTPLPTMTPTRGPATPTAMPLFTPTPTIGICWTATPLGTVCEQPSSPRPTATAILPCPVLDGQPCLWSGGEVRWLTPTAANP